MTFEEAELLAQQLTEMATTGEDFLAGDSDGEIVIDRHLAGRKPELEDRMTIPESIEYARVFASDGATKCCEALRFLTKHDTDKHQLTFLRSPLNTALAIIRESQ